MLFVSGIHGSGKTTFCAGLSEALGIPTYSASALIKAWRKSQSWSEDKKASQINVNQHALISAVAEVKQRVPFFILDGHFVLLSSDGLATNVDFTVFDKLGITGIILVQSPPETVAERLNARDMTTWEVPLIVELMNAEKEQAVKYSLSRGKPFILQNGDMPLDMDDGFLYEVSTWPKNVSPRS
ncbi:TPA: ATP-binding protein [Pseudomonas aeruginosa]|uniref:ATP-binding protein n=1 Tax=Pseudomonas putida TaxID=303 RepID=UPI0029D182E1|nr:AAA family ATPase [Pseudomonas aeruginosa]ELY3119102.1 AAA family ATPase [Pseudomonas aeruginosa]HEJ1785882.1 AAA family ATPase [Pseudomonas aeruginosa]HEJ2581102.1 AAA family ATPase [Pseudomonas aeruginosa]HEJ6257490.1 AAA family ATPase [Pseudomonas aeruginosa]